MPLGGAVLTTAREVQVPILALLLIGACLAKAQRAASARSLDAVGMRRSTMLALCLSELGLGTGLIVTAGRVGAATDAVSVRAGTALLFAIAVAALNEIRARRPGVGCGCFGDLSETPVSVRSMVRAGVLCAAAMASIGAPPLHLPSSSPQALLLVAVAVAEVLLLAAVSPEIGEIMVRLGYSEPCEARRVPVGKTLAALRASREWRDSQPYLVMPEPADIWREGCWRFLAYPATVDDRKADIVFAVYLQARRPAVRTAVVEADEPAQRRPRPAGPVLRPGPAPLLENLAASSRIPRVADNLDTHSPAQAVRSPC
ncbi:MAG TPA: MauE/DoxX family redox-associated membrane protein [Trebonia sp.]|nr:MauE/DoxX family redox-associated membrane protein [Trebonia sp.]